MSLEPEHSEGERSEESANQDVRDSLEELRKLLVGPERVAIDDLRERLNNPRRRARDLGEVLPEALSSSANRDGEKLQAVLTPSIEETLRISIRRDPKVVADAIFPVIGPAIRKALSETLSGMIQSLNTLVESTCSLRGLRWRFEAFQTGRPFAEVALLHSLEYSVDELFLIHAESGLLLQHVVDPVMPEKNADTLAAMLTAIRDFIRDSFQTNESESLESARVGNLTLVIEPGPLAVLVAVVRGNPPEGLRVQLRDRIETIHNQFGAWLQEFSGDAAPFEAARPALEACIQKRYSIQPPSNRRLIVPGILVAVGVLALGVFLIISQWRWTEAVRNVKAQPGLLVLRAERQGLGFAITGLRDPLAASPSDLLEKAGINLESVEQEWHAYFSNEGIFVLERARSILEPPESLELEITNGVLRASGSAPPLWIREKARLAAFVPGLTGHDLSAVHASHSVDFQNLATEIEQTVLLFDGGSSLLNTNTKGAMASLSELITRLLDQAEAEGIDLQIHVIGHANAVGSESINSAIAEDRARTTANALIGEGVPENILRIKSLGDSVMAPGANSRLDPINRRVTFEIKVRGVNRQKGSN